MYRPTAEHTGLPAISSVTSCCSSPMQDIHILQSYMVYHDEPQHSFAPISRRLSIDDKLLKDISNLISPRSLRNGATLILNSNTSGVTGYQIKSGIVHVSNWLYTCRCHEHQARPIETRPRAPICHRVSYKKD